MLLIWLSQLARRRYIFTTILISSLSLAILDPEVKSFTPSAKTLSNGKESKKRNTHQTSSTIQSTQHKMLQAPQNNLRASKWITFVRVFDFKPRFMSKHPLEGISTDSCLGSKVPQMSSTDIRTLSQSSLLTYRKKPIKKTGTSMARC